MKPFVVELFGKPRLLVRGSASEPGQLLARLATAHPKALGREELVFDLYPEVDPLEARNRLRVALSRLRKQIPLLEYENLVSLDGGEVTVDLYEARLGLQPGQEEPDGRDEAVALSKWLPWLKQTLFPGATHDWELQAQAEWAQSAGLVLERLSELGEELLDASLTATASEALIDHFPGDVAAWNRYLSSMVRLGRPGEASRKLSTFDRRLRQEGVELPEAISAWNSGLSGPSLMGPGLSPGEVRSFEGFFRRAMEVEPELAVQILGSPSFRPEVIRSPEAVLPLLREVARLDTPPSEAKERIQVRIITALSLTESDAEVLSEVASFLSRPIAPSRRRIALLAAAFSHAVEGNLSAAMVAIDEAESLVSGPLAEHDRYECRAQRATIQLLDGNFETAERELRAAIDFFEHSPLEGAERDRLAIRGNLGLCLLCRGRYAESSDVLRVVVEQARTNRLGQLIGLNAPTLGLALCHQGVFEPTLFVEGIRSAYRLGHRRAIAAASFVARGLSEIARDPDCRYLKEAFALRGDGGTPLNAVERGVFSPVLNTNPAASRPLVEFLRSLMRACSQSGGE